VWFREHSVLLRGSESRALATTGAFRVVHADDLRDSRGHSFDPRSGELRHLREQKLVRTIPIRDGRALVVLTERGRDVLERNRHEREQPFYSGLQRPRELLHDAKVYRAYEREVEHLREDGAVINRVMLDTELKREYQQFLQEHNRGKSDSDGRPDRSPDEIARWAMDHDLPEKDGHVQFPDARIVYEDRDGREHTRDIEVETLNYRGAHASAKASSGFSRHSAAGMRVGRLTWGGWRRQPARQRRIRLHRQHRQERWSRSRPAPRRGAIAMNFDHVVGTIVSKGFTERQARFLVLVARHSGVCVMRQCSRSQALSSATPRGSSSPSSNASVGSRPTTARASERASTTCAIASCTRPSAMPSPASGVRPPCHERLNASCCSTSS
jgi:hypothetical protein